MIEFKDKSNCTLEVRKWDQDLIHISIDDGYNCITFTIDNRLQFENMLEMIKEDLEKS